MEVAHPVAAVSKRAGFRRLLVSLGIAGGALSAMYAGVGTVLLPLQIERIDPAHKVAVLGVVAGVSAVFALVFNPIGGALSDRTRSRFGRRAPWLVGASAGLLVMLVLLGQASAVPLILVAWCLAQAVANLYQAPLTAVVPDRVARARRGAASSVAGVASVAGGVAGVGLATLFSRHLALGYPILGLVLVLTAWYFVLTTADQTTGDQNTGDQTTGALPRPARDTRRWRARIGDFLSALRSRDFALVFASRAAAILGATSSWSATSCTS